MNTAVEYLYRDGGNFKQWETVVVAGAVAEMEARLRACCDTTYGDPAFIPQQVGLPALQGRFCNGVEPDLDHPWHELTDVFSTDREPTVPFTAEELLRRFEDVAWDEVAASRELGLSV